VNGAVIDYRRLTENFKKLLGAQCSEQVYQDFLERYPAYVPREFIQNHGVHFSLILRKVKFGNEYVSDFVYLSKSSGDWNVVLVELEKPQSRFFKDDKSNLHEDFLTGIQQIGRWRAWFEEPANRAYFLDKTLGFLRVPLRDNPCRIKYVLVTGRTAEAVNNANRRYLIGAQEADDMKILSYDSLLELEEQPPQRYVGALRGLGLDLLSSTFATDSVFVYLQPEQLRITDALRASCITERSRWLTRRTDDDGYVIEERLPRIGRLDDPERAQLTSAAAQHGIQLP
jgi:hypothetical protein